MWAAGSDPPGQYQRIDYMVPSSEVHSIFKHVAGRVKAVLACCSVFVGRCPDPDKYRLGLCILQLVGLVDRVNGVQ